VRTLNLDERLNLFCFGSFLQALLNYVSGAMSANVVLALNTTENPVEIPETYWAKILV
jgi:hypothetical protein